MASTNSPVQTVTRTVTLKATYLEALSARQHTLRVDFTDGYAERQFMVNVAAKTAIPKTGDRAQPLVCLGILLMAGAVLVAGSSASRRRQDGQSTRYSFSSSALLFCGTSAACCLGHQR